MTKLKLTKKQKELVQPLLDRAHNAYLNNRSGSVLAQIYSSGKITVHFIPYEQTKEIFKILDRR